MRKLYTIVAPILTGLMWVALILFVSVTVKLITGGEGDEELVDTTTTISIIVALATTFIWTPRGIMSAEETDKVIKITAIYSYRANYIVQNQMFKQLNAFCEQKNIDKEHEIIITTLANYELDQDDLATYKAIYEKTTDLTEEEQEKFLKRFNWRRKRVMKRLCTKRVKFRKLKGKHIIHTHNSADGLVPVNKEHLSRGIAVAIKVVWGIFIGVFIGAFILSRKDNFGIGEIIKILIWSASIVGNVFTSVRQGYTSVYNLRCNYLIEKSDLTAEFFAYCGLTLPDVEKNLKIPEPKNA